MIALLFAVVRWALLFALGLLLGAQAMALLDPAEPATQLPLVKADFPVCVTIKPGPIGKPHRAISGRALLSEIS